MGKARAVRYAEVEPGYRVGSDGSFWSRWHRAAGGRTALGDAWRRKRPPSRENDRPRVYFRGGVQRQLADVVLTAFAGPRPGGLIARHRNGNTADCRLSNLYWGPRRNPLKFTREVEAEILAKRAAGATFREIAAPFGVSVSRVRQVATRAAGRADG